MLGMLLAAMLHDAALSLPIAVQDVAQHHAGIMSSLLRREERPTKQQGHNKAVMAVSFVDYKGNLTQLSPQLQLRLPDGENTQLDSKPSSDEDEQMRLEQLPEFSSKHFGSKPSFDDVAKLISEDNSTLKSQGGQDKYVLQEFLRNDLLFNRGVFFEFGARNGVDESNSHFFEHVLGWRGLLAEAIPNEQGHIVRERPRSVIFDGAFCPERGISEMETIGIAGQSGLPSTYDTQREERSADIGKVRVSCMLVGDVMEMFGIRRINYMSVDTEGSELSILQTFPFDKVQVDVLGVEVLKGNDSRTRKMEELVAFMESKNYTMHRDFAFASDTSDYFFVPKEPPAIKPDDIMFDLEKFNVGLTACRHLERCLS